MIVRPDAATVGGGDVTTGLSPHYSAFIHLPQLAAVHIQRREPATVAAVCVEALQVAKIQDFGLWCVADDGDLAGAMR